MICGHARMASGNHRLPTPPVAVKPLQSNHHLSTHAQCLLAQCSTVNSWGHGGGGGAWRGAWGGGMVAWGAGGGSRGTCPGPHPNDFIQSDHDQPESKVGCHKITIGKSRLRARLIVSLCTGFCRIFEHFEKWYCYLGQ